jgi:hypothetical protein
MAGTKTDWDQLLLRSEELAQQVISLLIKINLFFTQPFLFVLLLTHSLAPF